MEEALETQRALTNLASKLQDQRLKLDNKESISLFESTTEDILASLKKVNSTKEWNCLMNTLLSNNTEQEMQTQFKLLRNRRLKGRPVNGSVELFLQETRSLRAEHLKQQLVETLEDIEHCEAKMIALDCTENSNYNDVKRKRVMHSELQLKVNRLTEEYQHLLKAFRHANI